MAEIDIERRPRRNGWSWALGVLLLLLVAGVAWYFAAGPGVQAPDEGPADMPPPAPTAPEGGGPPPGGVR